MTLAQWMESKSLDVQALLDATGLERKVVEAIMQGRYTASPRQRQRLAAALGVEVDEVSWDYTIPVTHLYGHGPQFGRTP
jgi:transcriptional regulator with XRE-family HTH domain